MRACLTAVFLIVLCPIQVLAADAFEGGWKHKDPTGDGISEVYIERYGNTFVGQLEGGSSRGRLSPSKLKGWVENGKLYARICAQNEDDADDNGIHECLETRSVADYFVIRGKDMIWFKKRGAGWEELIELQRPKRAVKAP